MPFVKGQVANPKGKPKGTKCFRTIEKQGLINYLKEQGADKFIAEMDKLEGKDYCQIYIPVVELAFPKLSRNETKIEVEDKRVVID